MTQNDIAKIRLLNQQIGIKRFKTAKELLNGMGAMQAQDYQMAKFAVGLRLPNASEKMVQQAIDAGEILRTHVLRPTWHFVSSENIRWMLALTAPRILKSMKSSLVKLELSPTFLTKSLNSIEKALTKEKQLPRKELVRILEESGFKNEDNRMSHIFLFAELHGLICSGKDQDGKYTYALLDDRVPTSKSLHRDEALAKLASIYFSSHGPATTTDFMWWSGLSLTEARHGLDMAKHGFVSEEIDGQTYWFENSGSIPKGNSGTVHLLPAFDEFLISYKDRSAIVTTKNYKKAVSSVNGLFRPIIVLNGEIVGTWRRIFKKYTVIIEPALFKALSKLEEKQLLEQAEAFGTFLEKRVEVNEL